MTEAHNYPLVFSCIQGWSAKLAFFSYDWCSQLPPSFQMYTRKYWSTKLSFFLMTEAHNFRWVFSCIQGNDDLKNWPFFLLLKLTITILVYRCIQGNNIDLQNLQGNVELQKCVFLLMTKAHNYTVVFRQIQGNHFQIISSLFCFWRFKGCSSSL